MRVCRPSFRAALLGAALLAVATACGSADPPGKEASARKPPETRGGAAKETSKGRSVGARVVASDGMAESEPFPPRVGARNRPPEIAGVAIEPGRRIVAGTLVVLHPDATDPDGDGIRYRYAWTVNGYERREEGPLLDTARLARGDEIRVRVIASDGEDASEMLLPPMVVVNSPPRIVSRPPAGLDDGVFRYTVSARDPDGDAPLEYRLEDAPEGMWIDPSTGVIRWTPGADQTGLHEATVVAADGRDGVDEQRFEVSVPDPRAAPASAAPR